MITYLLMTAPMASLALVSWLRHPYKGKRSQVEVGKLGRNEIWFMLILSLAVTIVFLLYFSLFRHSKSAPEHAFCNNKFYCRLPHIQKKSVFRPRLCRKRYSFNCFMDTCNRRKHILFFGYNLLCYVSSERFIRLYKLAQNAKQAKIR